MGDKYQQNIFELLSEDGAKKQQKKQEVAAPAKKEKAKPKAAAPAPAAPKKNQGSQGRGRGGRGPRQGRGQQQTPLGVDDRNAQGAGNNRGRQASRRQRDEAFKRGDYGAPDAEGRQKRAYDKFSHSSGARRKQEKKGGHGAGNWGEKGKDEEEVPEEEKKEGEEIVENVEGEEFEGEGEEEEKEESDNEIDYDEFVERQKKESENLSKLVEVQEARKIDDAEFEGMKPLSKGTKDEQLFAITGGKNKKGKKAAGPKDGKISADKVLNFQAPRQDNRRGGKGRQNNRQQRGGNKRSANVNLNDDKDFPSL